MRIGARLGIAFGAVLALTAGVGWIGLDAVGRYERASDRTQAAHALNDLFTGAAATIRMEVDAPILVAVADALSSDRLAGPLDQLRGDDRSSAAEAAAQMANQLRTVADATDRRQATVNRMAEAAAMLRSRAAALATYAEGTRSRAEAAQSIAESNMVQRVTLRDAAERLIRVQSAAAVVEVLFQLDPPAQAQRMNAALRDVFVAAVTLRRHAAGTVDEGPVGRITEATNTYRRAVADMIGGSPAQDALSRASRQIGSFTAVVERRQIAAYEEATLAARTARQQAIDAFKLEATALRVAQAAEHLRYGLAQMLDADEAARTALQEDALATLRDIAELTITLAQRNDEEVNSLTEDIANASSLFHRNLEELVAELERHDAAGRSAADLAGSVSNRMHEMVASEVTALTHVGAQSRNLLATGTAIALLIGIAGATLLGRGISRPVAAITDAMQRLAQDDLDAPIPGRDRTDEIGAMAASVEVFRATARERQAMRLAQAEADARAETDRRSMLARVASDLEDSLQATLARVDAAVSEMALIAGTMSDIARDNATTASDCVSATSQSSASVETVAEATARLSAAIGGVSDQVRNGADMARRAQAETQGAQAAIGSLVEVAQRIDTVIGAINLIAGQTKLLALNATIEAARAGESGKGFAVVANEVKSLARQTEVATEDIVGQIAAIREAVDQAASTMQRMGSVVVEMESMSGVIDGAITEQTAVTRQIARNTDEAAAGSRTVLASIEGLAQRASEIGAISSQVAGTADLLAQEANAVRRAVGDVVQRLRAS